MQLNKKANPCLLKNTLTHYVKLCQKDMVLLSLKN